MPQRATYLQTIVYDALFTTLCITSNVKYWLPAKFQTRLHDRNPLPQMVSCTKITLQWRHNERDGVSNHQPHDCLLNCIFRPRSTKISKLRVTDLCAGNSPMTGEFPSQRASNAGNVSIWWRHHDAHSLGMVSFVCGYAQIHFTYTLQGLLIDTGTLVK